MDEQNNAGQGAGAPQDTPVDKSVETVDYKTLYTGLCETVKELQAERDSLRIENDGLRKQQEQLTVETQKVRETNYTLSRQLDLTQAGAVKTPEEILYDAFIKK